MSPGGDGEINTARILGLCRDNRTHKGVNLWQGGPLDMLEWAPKSPARRQAYRLYED